jgi:signal recognition particle GTPase
MVAEALVGNGGINQLQMFDQAIQSSSIFAFYFY